MVELRLHLSFGPYNADIILHRLLEIALQCIGIFALAPLKRPQRFMDHVFDFTGIDRTVLILLRELGGKFAGAFSENQKIRQRISAQSIGTVNPGTRDICVSESTRIPPIT